MKSKITQNTGESFERINPSLDSNKSSDNKTYYGDRNNSSHATRYRSKSKGRRSSRHSQRRGYSTRRFNSDSKYDDEPWRRNSNKNKNYDQQKRRSSSNSKGNWRFRGRSSSGARQDRRRGRSGQLYERSEVEHSTSEDEVNNVHYSEFNFQDKFNSNCEASDFIKDGFDKNFIDVLYNSNSVDPFKLVVDSGCPKTVTGRPWIDSFIESRDENESFKFGPSKVYKSL